jgi:hypothetical protein
MNKLQRAYRVKSGDITKMNNMKNIVLSKELSLLDGIVYFKPR